MPGIAEAIRAHGVAKGVPTAVLSRGLAGVVGSCLVVNLPGSRGGVKDGARGARTGAGARRGAGRRERPLSRPRPAARGGWPVRLRHGEVLLRPLRVSDAEAWRRARQPQRRLAAAVGRDRAARGRPAAHDVPGAGPAAAPPGPPGHDVPVRRRGRRRVRRAGDGQQRRARLRAVRLGRLLDRPALRRARDHAAGGRDGHRPLLLRRSACTASRSRSAPRTPTRCGSSRSSASTRSATPPATCTSTAPGATTGSTRSPSRSASRRAGRAGHGQLNPTSHTSNLRHTGGHPPHPALANLGSSPWT